MQMTMNRYSWTGHLYGDLAHSNHILFKQEDIERGQRSVRRGLARMKIDVSSLRNKHVLDVGTGLYGLGFNSFGALVDHRDISQATVSSLNAFISEKKVRGISSTLTDLVNDGLPEDIYDVVYLSGIFQHFSDPIAAIANISRSMKSGGLLYLDFYRSGRWRWFVVETIRSMVRRKDLSDTLSLWLNVVALGRRDAFDLPQVEFFVDDVFVEHLHLAQSEDVINLCKNYSLQPVSEISSMDLIDRSTTSDHSLFFAHIFNTVVFQKVEKSCETLSPPSIGRSQLDDIRTLPHSYRDVATLTEALRFAIDTGRFSRSEVRSIVTALYRMAHPSLPNDPYFVAGTFEGFDNGRTRGNQDTLSQRHLIWCDFISNLLQVNNPLPGPVGIVSLGYDLERFLDD
jgi:SAM-dependent methyltransferase